MLAAANEPLDLSSPDSALNDIERGDDWDDERVVPAELIIELATTGSPDSPPLRRLWLRGARIDGRLGLNGARVLCPLRFENCFFGANADFAEAELPSLRLPGCLAVEGLSVSGARIRGDLALNGGFDARATVDLTNCEIGADLYCAGGSFADPGGIALWADQARIAGSAYCGSGFKAEGAVRLVGAQIGGQLICTEGQFSNAGDSALMLDRATIGGAVRCRTGFVADGAVRLVGAQIGGHLSCQGGRFSNPEGLALIADGSTVGVDMACGEGFVAEGEVRLLGAQIRGQLQCDGGSFLNPGQDALSADQAVIGEGVFCQAEFVAEGTVRLIGTRVGGQLSCSGGHFSNPGGEALLADRAIVGGTVFLADKFVAEGAVRLVGAEIESQLVCTGGRFLNPGGAALVLENAKINRGMFCTDGFLAEGAVHLTGATIGASLYFRGVSRTDSSLAWDFEGIEVARNLYFQPVEPLQGWVDLTNAKIGHLYDTSEGWQGGVELTGLRYQSLPRDRTAPPRGVGLRRDSVLERRKAWLAGNRSGFSPQIYDQLAGAYRRAGDEARAQHVMIAKERRRRRHLGPPARAWSVVEDILVGYGYRTWQALLPFVSMLLFGFLFFGAHSDDITQKIPGQHPPEFLPLVYTLDLLLPVINLAQRDNWIAHGGVQAMATAFTLAGWVLTTAILAGLTGLVRRTD